MKNNLQNNKPLEKKIDWQNIKKELRGKFGNDIFESWIKKIDLVDEFHNYILFSVSTRFIRDWIVSRYLDQILQTIKQYKKDLVRIEFIIKNIDRSYEKISQFILTLDKYSLKKGSPFGLKLIKEVLKMI